jgi:hypothetical protein
MEYNLKNIKQEFKDIDNLINDLGGVLKIEQTHYINEHNKQQYKMYLLGRKYGLNYCKKTLTGLVRC